MDFKPGSRHLEKYFIETQRLVVLLGKSPQKKQRINRAFEPDDEYCRRRKYDFIVPTNIIDQVLEELRKIERSPRFIH
jgi:hypothetical protein